MDNHEGSDQSMGSSLPLGMGEEIPGGAEESGIQTETQEAEEGPTVAPNWDLATVSGPSNPAREDIEREFDALSRKPFQRILTAYIGFVPTASALRRFAERYPDKYAKSIEVLAQLAGYKRDTVEVNNLVMVGNMDDATILRKLREGQAQLASAERMITLPTTQPATRELAPSRDESIIDVEAKKLGERHE